MTYHYMLLKNSLIIILSIKEHYYYVLFNFLVEIFWKNFFNEIHQFWENIR